MQYLVHGDECLVGSVPSCSFLGALKDAMEGL